MPGAMSFRGGAISETAHLILVATSAPATQWPQPRCFGGGLDRDRDRLGDGRAVDAGTDRGGNGRGGRQGEPGVVGRRTGRDHPLEQQLSVSSEVAMPTGVMRMAAPLVVPKRPVSVMVRAGE